MKLNPKTISKQAQTLSWLTSPKLFHEQNSCANERVFLKSKNSQKPHQQQEHISSKTQSTENKIPIQWRIHWLSKP